MNLWDIAKRVGGAVLKDAIPGGGLLFDVINAALPPDKKMTDDATGHDLLNAIPSLPPDLQKKQFDVQITEIKEQNETARTMLESDAKNPQTTRPYIAKGSFQVVAVCCLLAISIWGYGVISNNDKMVADIQNGWPFLLSVIAPLTLLLRRYFGVLKDEHAHRMNAAMGAPIQSAIGSIVAALKK